MAMKGFKNIRESSEVLIYVKRKYNTCKKKNTKCVNYWKELLKLEILI